MPQEPSDTQLSALIVAAAQASWLNVAMVLARVGDLCEEQNLRFDPDVVALRIAVLVERGSLKGAGDLSRWQLGEVCLPGVS